MTALHDIAKPLAVYTASRKKIVSVNLLCWLVYALLYSAGSALFKDNVQYVIAMAGGLFCGAVLLSSIRLYFRTPHITLTAKGIKIKNYTVLDWEDFRGSFEHNDLIIIIENTQKYPVPSDWNIVAKSITDYHGENKARIAFDVPRHFSETNAVDFIQMLCRAAPPQWHGIKRPVTIQKGSTAHTSLGASLNKEKQSTIAIFFGETKPTARKIIQGLTMYLLLGILLYFITIGPIFSAHPGFSALGLLGSITLTVCAYIFLLGVKICKKINTSLPPHWPFKPKKGNQIPQKTTANKITIAILGPLIFPIILYVYFFISPAAVFTSVFGTPYTATIYVPDKASSHYDNCGYELDSPHLRNFIKAQPCVSEDFQGTMPRQSFIDVRGKKTIFGWTISEYRLSDDQVFSESRLQELNNFWGIQDH